jgi:hypothetical protein
MARSAVTIGAADFLAGEAERDFLGMANCAWLNFEEVLRGALWLAVGAAGSVRRD